MATGNHYVFDIAAGLVVSAAGYGLGTLAARGPEGMGSRGRLPLPAGAGLQPA